MKRNHLLLFAPLGAAILAAGVLGLPTLVPGYDQVRQTVSEIGEVGSPMQAPFTAMLCAVAACILIFAWGVRSLSKRVGRSAFPAYVLACMAISAAGVGIFSFPHPLHNVFGLSELIGYQAPAAVALVWSRDAKTRGLAAFSWCMFGVVWIALALNMSSLIRAGDLWAQIKPYYGLVQRALFAAWFSWCAIAGLMLWRRSGES